MEHDKCYATRGFADCACDVEFVRALNDYKDIPDDLGVIADKMAVYFTNSSCYGCKLTTYGAQKGYMCTNGQRYGCNWKSINLQKEKYRFCPSEPSIYHRCKTVKGQTVDLMKAQWVELIRTGSKIRIEKLTEFGCLYIRTEEDENDDLTRYCFDGQGRFPVRERIWISSEYDGKICVKDFVVGK